MTRAGCACPRLLLVVLFFLELVLEILDRAADAAAESRQAVCSENHDDNRQNDQ
jgi:hypothetical protein